MSTMTLTDTQALALGKQYRQASAALRKYRLAKDALSDTSVKQLKLIETSLRDAARDMTTLAVAIVIDEGQADLAALGAVTDDALTQLDTINGIKRVLSVATALLGLAAAIPTGKPAEVADAFRALRELLPTVAVKLPA
jgi:hypothetical protein